MNQLIKLKRILFFFLLLQISFNASAQFRIGTSFGLNFSDLSSTRQLEIETSALLTSFAYAQFGFGLTDKLSLNLETGVSGRGTTLQAAGNSFGQSFRVIGLDLMPSLEFKPIKMLGIGVGCYGSLNFAEASRLENGEWESFNNLDEFKAYDFGLHTYARAYYKFLFLQLGYDIGLVDVFDLYYTDQNGQTIGQGVGNFRDFRIGLGVLFEI